MIRISTFNLCNATEWLRKNFSKRRLAPLCLLAFIFMFQGYQVKAQNTSNYTSNHAPIGGGGFVSGIIHHKTSGDMYCRTDVGGAYRWDATNSKWIQLLDWISDDEGGFSGVESVALDPQNPNNVYMLAGIEYLNSGRTAILKSTDKGNTFTYTDVTSKFKAHGNGLGRSNGERLAVDPNNSNILFCGTRANGLWKSTDAGVTWNLAWNGVTTTPNKNGICFVLFNPNNVAGGITRTIYLGVSHYGSTNVYRSTDGGTTFSALSATLPTTFMPQRAALSGNMLYITYANGSGPHGNDDKDLNEPVDNGQVWSFNTSTSTATNITPVTGKAYSGVSVDPANANRVIVSTTNSWNNFQFSNAWGDFVYLSTNGGSTWTQKLSETSTLNTDGIGWISGSSIHWAGSIEFTPGNTAEVRVVSGNGIYTCSDISAENTSWKFDVKGIEETALLDGISIPGGPFISSFGDVCGFVHDPLTSFPSARISPTDKNNQSIAYAAGNTNKVVRASNEGSVIYYSTDKGATWTASATNMGADGRVTISADGGTILHCPRGSTTAWYTTNNGGSWSSCSGVSVENAAPIADQVNNNYFYIHNLSSGQMFVSSNKGVSFSVAGTPGGTSTPWAQTYIRTVPGYEGHLWVPLVGNGLKYSTDHGATFTTVSNVTYCSAIGFGKADVSAAYPTIFIWGTVEGVRGLFRSTDQGASWIRINDNEHQFGGTRLVIGDLNVFGRVYMSGISARGLTYWEPATANSGGGAGTILREYWTGISGTSISDLTSNANYPDNPTGSSQLTSLEGPTNWADNYGTRIRGYIHPTTSGSYTFWVAGDDNTDLYLSTNDNPANAARIAYVEDWTNSREWNKYGTQQSASINLTAGQKYYVEVLHKDAFGGDNVAVAWQGPGISQQMIGGSFLSPYDPEMIVVRARGTLGGETIDLRIDDSTVATWTLTTSYADYTASGSGTVSVHFTNDDGGRDVQVDYIAIDGATYQSENQATNTGVWQNNSCGGSNSEWLNCNGYISYTAASAGAGTMQTDANVFSKTVDLLSKDVDVLSKEVTMYPNPANEGRFFIALPGNVGDATVNVHDKQGRLLYEKHAEGDSKLELDYPLSPGVYFINVKSDQFNVTKKLIVD